MCEQIVSLCITTKYCQNWFFGIININIFTAYSFLIDGSSMTINKNVVWIDGLLIWKASTPTAV